MPAGDDTGDAGLRFGVCLRFAYEGTDFHGWQRQPNVRTVQETLERAIDGLGVKRSGLRGVSRTDAGVHAADQVASFATDRDMPPRAWVHALNRRLPDDLSVRVAAPCAPRYDPRRHAVGKLYRYRMHAAPVRDALRRRWSWLVDPTMARRDRRGPRGPRIDDYLDVEAMQRAASVLVGTHDFHAFRQSDDERENTVRTMRQVAVIPAPGGAADELAIEVHGTAFMKNMVRIFAGTLADVGRHRIPVERMAEFLSPDADRADLGPTAPAHGLTLVRVELEDAPDGPEPAPPG